MRSFSYLFTLLWTLSLPVNATSTASTTTVIPSLGLMHLRTTDEIRRHWSGTGHRPLALDLYYPTISPDGSHWSTKRFNYGYVARQAPRMQKKHPLILLSHGSRSHAGQLLWLIEPLVQAGFIVAAVNHHGNTSREPTFYDAAEQLWWERAADLQAAIVKLQQDPNWSTYLAFDRLGLIGFSIGGHTVLANLGAITDTQLFQQACQREPSKFLCIIDRDIQADLPKHHQDHPAAKAVYQQALANMKSNYRIPQARAAFIMAPAYTAAFTTSSLHTIQTPILTLIGELDTRIDRQQASYALRQPPASQVITLKQVQHFSFLSECTLLGHLFDKNSLCDEHPNTNRHELHQQIAQQAVAFLKLHINKPNTTRQDHAS